MSGAPKANKHQATKPQATKRQATKPQAAKPQATKRQGTKRQRSNAEDSAETSRPVNYLWLMGMLPPQVLNKILLQAAHEHPDVGDNIVEAHSKVVKAEQAKAIDFDRYSKSAWRVLNADYSGMSGSKQYDKSFEVSSEVEEYINAIGKATPEHANFGTKKSALETLRQIGKIICLCQGDTLHREVVVQFQSDDNLETTMLRIAKSLTGEERKKITEEFMQKLMELESLGAGHCLFEKLERVRLVLLGQELDDDEDSE